MSTFTCYACKQPIQGTTYGIDDDGHKHCYACCGDRDRKSMAETGRFTGYVILDGYGNPYKVTNWPGTLRFVVDYSIARNHNWCGVDQVYIWFGGPEGRLWLGRWVRSRESEIVRCKRLKKDARIP